MVKPTAACVAALIPEPEKARGVRWVAGQHGATLAGGDLFVGIETEDGEATETARKTPVKARADGLGSIFDECQVMALRKILEGIHLGRDAEGVNRKDGTSTRRDSALYGRGVD